MSSLLILWTVLAPSVLTAAATSRRRSAQDVGRIATTALISAAGTSLVLLVLAAGDDAERIALDVSDWVVLRIDRPAAMLLLTFSALGAVVAAFSARAFDDGPRTVAHHVWLCVLVGGASLVAVPGGPVPLLAGWLISAWALERLVVGWVGTTTARAAYRRMRRATFVGDAAIVLAVVSAIAAVGPDLLTATPSAVAELDDASLLGLDAAAVFALLIVVAGVARSSLVPFHRWLSATLYAPTPVSAIVHAGFVSGAGLLLIRFAPVIVDVDVAIALAGAVAIATIGVGTVASLSRPDVKGGLAWSTVAQMAFMVLQCAVGAFAGAVVHIIGHGMYKSVQFLGAGETVADSLRKRRRPTRDASVDRALSTVVVLVVPTIAVALGLLIGPSGTAAEHLLLGGFAWVALAAAVSGELRSNTLGAGRAIALATAGSISAALAYFGGLRIVKRFLEPSLGGLEADGTIAVVLAVTALATVGAIAAIVALPSAAPLRVRLRAWCDRWIALRPTMETRRVTAPDHTAPDGPSAAERAGGEMELTSARLRIQVGRAAELVSPMWPLSSFVAVNPLGGLEHLDFDAAATAARPLRGRTYRTLSQYRDDHESGATDPADLEWATHDVAFVACTQPPLAVGDRTIAPAEVVIADVLFGPEVPEIVEPRTTLERRFGTDIGDRLGVDELVSSWVLDHLARPTLSGAAPGLPFWNVARRRAIDHAGRLAAPARAFLESLGDDPLDALGRSLTVLGVPDADRTDEVRGLLAAVPGCVGIARWRSEWAHGDEPLPPLGVVELAAIRAALDAALLIDLEGRRGGPPPAPAHSAADAFGADPALVGRAQAVIGALGLPADDPTRQAIVDLLALVPDPMRQAIWQRAQEHHFDLRALTALDRVDPGPTTDRPASQVVFCIDVRSEGLRRHLEDFAVDETVGFAGFFGIPMQVRELGWSHAETRCPVLVSPGAKATEVAPPEPDAQIERALDRKRRRAAGAAAHGSSKQVAGAQFATAEAAGWITGPLAAWRTLRPPRWTPEASEPLPTRVLLERDSALDQRVDSAEAVLRTSGLVERLARLVVLCGHTSDTTNNPHLTALECGACAGAGGAANARAVAALLNEPDVRTGLAGRGIEIPEDTWFCGAIHETTTDSVTLLDNHLAPSSHLAELAELQQRLDLAAERQAAARARFLPGPLDTVRDRGRDWAQPRPEWGLARNAAFVIAPRSATEGLDLDGRAFLHSYDARLDPDGSVLETIMTAPLVVGHWISAQYYFSTVDPETFGSGDKLLHNPVTSIGVLTGAGGDLRVGLPLQSTHVDGQPFHRPLRLLAVIQADLTTVESIISRNPVLHQLVRGSWLRIAARSHPHEPWSTRSREGTWSTIPTQLDPLTTLECS